MNFMGIGPLELLLILAIALVVLGPGRVVDTGRKLGRFVGQVRKVTSDLPSLMEELVAGEEETPHGIPPVKQDQDPQDDAKKREA